MGTAGAGRWFEEPFPLRGARPARAWLRSDAPVLDLSGAWSTDAELRLKMTVGELALRLPKDVGIRIRMDRFLASFPSEGWTRQGTTYLSAGYARARRHVDIELTTTLGGVTVEWLP